MKYPKHIEVIDDFLSNEEFTDLINIVNDDFAWYRGYTIDENSDNEFTPIKKYTPKEKSKQFRHIFIHHEHGENSPYVSVIYPILFKLKAKNVLKVKMNLTTNSNKAVCTINFGADKTVTSGTFTIQFPAQTAGNAIIQIA